LFCYRSRSALITAAQTSSDLEVQQGFQRIFLESLSKNLESGRERLIEPYESSQIAGVSRRIGLQPDGYIPTLQEGMRRS